MEKEQLIKTIEQAQLGDKEAFESLFRHSYQYVKANILKYGIAYGECDDVLQEVFLEAYRSLHKLENPICYQKWLYKVIQSKCYKNVVMKNKRDRFEEYKDEIQQSELYEAYEPETSFNRLSIRNELIQLLDSLNEEMKQVIILKYIMQLTIGEISDQYDIPLGTVKSRLHYAKSKLRVMADDINIRNDLI